jgi:hypothetical protein
VFNDGEAIDVDGTMTATSLKFDVSGLTGAQPITVVDYTGGTFNGPALLSPSSSKWALRDTGSTVEAFQPAGTMFLLR